MILPDPDPGAITSLNFQRRPHLCALPYLSLHPGFLARPGCPSQHQEWEQWEEESPATKALSKRGIPKNKMEIFDGIFHKGGGEVFCFLECLPIATSFLHTRASLPGLALELCGSKVN